MAKGEKFNIIVLVLIFLRNAFWVKQNVFSGFKKGYFKEHFQNLN